MEQEQKAIIRMEHWLKHNEGHLDEYKQFAEKMDKAGNKETARHIQDMAAFIAQSNECLGKALASLKTA